MVTPSPDGGGARYYGEASRVLFGLGCVVLLACCGNVSTVLLAHGASRRRELGIRTALGASRWDSARQLLADSFMLSFAGGAAGMVLAVWAGPLLLSQFNDSGLDLTLNSATRWRVWASAAATVLLTSKRLEVTINGGALVGAQPLEAFVRVIDDELARSGR